MKRIVCLLLTALLLTVTLSAAAGPESLIGTTFPDFTVTAYGGETFTLSEALETHDLVVINFWASWCGPCQYEFPYMEAAYEQYADRVAVIALSVEPGDTDKVFGEFVDYFHFKFHVGRDQENLFRLTQSQGIPTTLIIGSGRTVLAADVGAKTSISAFTKWFDSFLPAASGADAE